MPFYTLRKSYRKNSSETTVVHLDVLTWTGLYTQSQILWCSDELQAYDSWASSLIKILNISFYFLFKKSSFCFTHKNIGSMVRQKNCIEHKIIYTPTLQLYRTVIVYEHCSSDGSLFSFSISEKLLVLFFFSVGHLQCRVSVTTNSHFYPVPEPEERLPSSCWHASCWMLLFHFQRWGWHLAVQSSDSRGVSLPALLFFPPRTTIWTVPKSPFDTCCSGLKRIIHGNSRW